jgi:hypothetical protein
VRISERKRQLREVADNPDALVQRQNLRAAAQAQPQPVARKVSVRPRAEAGSTKVRASAAPAGKAGKRKPRGSGFYTGFGAFGLFFAVLFGATTYSTYRSDSDKYPGKVVAYHAAQVTYAKQIKAYDIAQTALTAYHKQLSSYNTAVSKHVKPLPAKPIAPQAVGKPKALQAAPTKPVLNMGSFALPVLYALLSIAYLYLGYRTRMKNAALASAAAPAKRADTRR